MRKQDPGKGAGRRKPLTAISASGRAVAPGRSSSSGMSRLIRHYRQEARLHYKQAGLNGTISLIPNVSVAAGQMSVEFRIGSTRKYILKNIPLFAGALKHSERAAYGKGLEFYHTLEAFTPQSRPMAEFLLLEEESESKKREEYGWQHYGQEGNHRFLKIHCGNMDAFFAALGDAPFSVCMNYGEKRMWRVSEQERVPTLELRGEEGGAVLEAAPLFHMYGAHYAYLWEDGVIYKKPIEEAQKMRPFWDYVNDYKYGEFFISNSDLPAFCRDLLPVLERHCRVLRDQFEEAQYLPPEPEYEIYLDAPDKHRVTCEMYVSYGDKKYNVCEKPRAIENRDEMGELRRIEELRPWFLEEDPQKKQWLIAGDEEKMYELLAEGLEELARIGTVFVSDALKAIKVSPAPDVTVGVALKGDLLELTLESEEMTLEEMVGILASYQRKRKFYRLKDGDFLSMEGSGLSIVSRIGEHLSISPEEWGKGSVFLPKYRALYLDRELREQGGFRAAKNREFKALVRNMKTVEDNDFEVPRSLGRVMREYQKQGFLWLKTLKNNGFGGILADEMGLGKTLQVLAFLLSEWEEGAWEGCTNFALIVCPASLVYNWKSEAERFAPELNAVAVTGTAAERREKLQQAGRGDILITSYDLLKRDVEHYEELEFGYEIIDEAQYIKNQKTKSSKAAKEIHAGFRAALTGTPIENRLSELWSIFDYLMPGFLYPYARFREELEIPIVVNGEEEAQERLRGMIRPFVLRRLKKDVLKDLPEKMEEAVFAGMEEEQGKLYAAHARQIRRMLEGQTEAEFSKKKLQVLAELTRLRQLCCDPALVYADYKGGSGKLLVCMDLIRQALDGGHKILLFSQFTTMLSRLQEHLEKEGVPYFCLTGSVGKEERARMVEAFQRGEAPVFCISLRAGGTGINLTAADIVIHYDPWWNVAVQDQATGRAHRIGQKNPVTAYKLIAKGTVEENILKLQEKKRELADRFLGNGGLEDVKLTKEELLELL